MDQHSPHANKRTNLTFNLVSFKRKYSRMCPTDVPHEGSENVVDRRACNCHACCCMKTMGGFYPKYRFHGNCMMIIIIIECKFLIMQTNSIFVHSKHIYVISHEISIQYYSRFECTYIVLLIKICLGSFVPHLLGLARGIHVHTACILSIN